MVALGWQIQQTAADAARQGAQDQAKQSASAISALFEAWRDELLVAAGNAALTDWYERPGEQPALRRQIDEQLVRLHEIYPTLIDEACFISAQGPELARQVKGEPAAPADLSPDESGSAFFAPTMALQPGQVWQNPPYISADSHRWVVSNSTPIEVGGRPTALLHFEANLDAVRTRVGQELRPGMAARIIDTGTGKVIADTSLPLVIEAAPFTSVGAWATAVGPVRARAAVTVDAATNPNRWVVEISAPAPRPFTTAILLRAGGMVLLALALVALVALRFAAAVARPLGEVTRVAESLAAGDLSQQAHVERRDELGRLATAVNQAVTATKEHTAALERAHLAQQEQMSQTHQRLQASDRSTRRRAQEIIDETATTVVTELQEVVGHVDDVRAGASMIDERVTAADSVTEQLVDRAQSVERVVATLTENLRRVGGIADMINAVASQTNLLALNATIESARAGQAGAAFGVVAGEVKNLASTTAASSAEITATIQSVDRDISEATAAISSMLAQVSGIAEATGDVRAITIRQQEAVALLADRFAGTTARVQGMTKLTETLERRQQTRHAVDLGATLDHRGATHDIRVRDLSESGAGVTVPGSLPLAVGDHVTLHLSLHGRAEVLDASVARCEPDGGRVAVGLAFDSPRPDLVAEL